MKKLLFIAAIFGFTVITQTSTAQVENSETKEQKENQAQKALKEAQSLKEQAEQKKVQEIVIRKKGDKDSKIVIEVQDNKVLINGKPISEFKDGDIVVNFKNLIVEDGNRNFSFDTDNFAKDFYNKNKLGNKAILGVTTKAVSDDEKLKGATILAVTNGSAAEKAGLKEGDIITKIDDKNIDGPKSLSEAIASYKPNEEVTVYYTRNGQQNNTKASLGKSRSAKMNVYSYSDPNGNDVQLFNMPPDSYGWNDNGLKQLRQFKQFDEMNNQFDKMDDMFPQHQKLGLKIQDTEDGNGVKILDTEKDSPAQNAGLQKDDIITEIGGKKITNTNEAREQLQEDAQKYFYNIKVNRNGVQKSFDIKIKKKLHTANL